MITLLDIDIELAKLLQKRVEVLTLMEHAMVNDAIARANWSLRELNAKMTRVKRATRPRKQLKHGDPT